MNELFKDLCKMYAQIIINEEEQENEEKETI